MSRSPPTPAPSRRSTTSRSRSQRGEVLAIVGESGSGKTVTAKTILGLLPETATTRGAVILANREGTRESDVISVSKQKLREHPRHRRRDGVPGAVDGAEPGLHGRLADRRGPARPRRRVEEGGARARRSTSSRTRRHPRPRARGSTTTRTSSRAARSSASSSRWRSCSTPGSSSPTSRPPPST